MSNDLNNFHHLGVLSSDMNGTTRAYEKLGFVFSPVSIPKIPLSPRAAPEEVGVVNRCAIFQNNYLEMLGVVNPARWASITTAQRGPYDIDKPLARYPGLHVLHLNADDLEAARIRMEKEGLQPGEIRPFQRMVDTTQGEQMMRARAFSFPPGSNPEAQVQIAHHETPELVLQPRYMNHPNGAKSISEAILCVEDPDAVSRRYAKYTGHKVRKAGDLHIVDMGAARIAIMGPDHLTDVLPGVVAPTYPFLAGFTMTADMEAARSLLKQNAIDVRMHGDRIIVSPRDGAGAAVLFESPHGGR